MAILSLLHVYANPLATSGRSPFFRSILQRHHCFSIIGIMQAAIQRPHSLRLHRVALYLQGWHALMVLASSLSAHNTKPKRLLKLFASGITHGLAPGRAFWMFYTSTEQMPSVYLWSHNGESYIGKAKSPAKRLSQHLRAAHKLRVEAGDIDKTKPPRPSRVSDDTYTMFFHTELALRGVQKFCVIPIYGPCALSELDGFERKLIRAHTPIFNRAHSRAHCTRQWKNGINKPTSRGKTTATANSSVGVEASPPARSDFQHRPDMLVPYRFHCKD